MVATQPPLALVAELSHRCPLQCPYCANPVDLLGASAELATEDWRRIITQAAALGVLQLHLSGGEPLVRRDLAALIRHASEAGLYTNLITSGVGLDAARAAELAACGLDHVQLSFQDAQAEENDGMAGFAGAFAHKFQAATATIAAQLPLTTNFVVYRDNIHRVAKMIDLGLALGASRIEIAHVQYHGWAILNRSALLPDRASLDQATEAVRCARAALAGRCVIDYVVPDYHAHTPKACMGGWGRRTITVTPNGRALPCHAAQTIPGLDFPDLTQVSLSDAWSDSMAFNAFRGTAWMPEPCQSCSERDIDFGGCRCQAMALTGEATATDPVCHRSPDHAVVVQLIEKIDAARSRTVSAPGDAEEPAPPIIFRRITSQPYPTNQN